MERRGGEVFQERETKPDESCKSKYITRFVMKEKNSIPIMKLADSLRTF